MVLYNSQAEFHGLLQSFHTKYRAMVQKELRESPEFLCTQCWLHGPSLWMELTKGAVSPLWCEMMNNCLVQALECAMFYGQSLATAQYRFMDYTQHQTLFADFFHIHFPENVPNNTTFSPQEEEAIDPLCSPPKGPCHS